MKKRTFSWRVVRIAVAGVVLTLAAVSFVCPFRELLFGTALTERLGSFPAMLMHVQFGPAVMKCVAAFSIGTLATALAIALLTFLFGRFYCACLCPFGILQDFIGFLSRRQARPEANFAKTRYVIAGLAFATMFMGWTTGFKLLDPYTNFGRICASFLVGGFAPFLVIAILAVWKKRLYCTTICPVGTLLGLLARHGLVRMEIGEQCVKCGQCVRNCPAGCLDLTNGLLDNERCVRCLNCLSVCPLHTIQFTLSWKAKANEPDLSRRQFLSRCVALAVGAAIGLTLAKTGMLRLAEKARQFPILPPGADNLDRFLAKCTGCQLCTANCPAGIIVPGKGGLGPVSLDFTRGFCLYDCHRCGQVCPTGAIRPLTLAQKRQTKIAVASFDARHCLVFQEGIACGQCGQACPTKAITLRKNGAPRAPKPDLCIGCGACQNVCPANPKAMTVGALS